jgi:hypothetical protein
MLIADALRLARTTLADAPGIVVNRHTGRAHVLGDAPDAIHDRVDAHNALFDHGKALQAVSLTA